MKRMKKNVGIHRKNWKVKETRGDGSPERCHHNKGMEEQFDNPKKRKKMEDNSPLMTQPKTQRTHNLRPRGSIPVAAG